MHLGDLREFVETPELTFNIGEKRYTVEAVDAKTWLRLQEMQAVTEGVEGADRGIMSLSRAEFAKLVLGEGVFNALTEDGVKGAHLLHIVRSAFYWQLGEQEVSRMLWAEGKAEAPETGDQPPAPAAAPATTRKATSTAGGAATTTRRRASTSGTKSRPKSQRQSVVEAAPV